MRIAPRVDSDLIVRRAQTKLVCHRLKVFKRSGGQFVQLIRFDRPADRLRGINRRAKGNLLALHGQIGRGGLEKEPGPRVATFVQNVIDQARVTPDGDAFARRIEICLGRDRVLIIAEIIAGIGEHFDECDAEIGHVALAPFRHGEREAIENELAETGIIFRQIIDLRLVAFFGRTDARGPAIQLARTARLERKIPAAA